MSRYDDIIHLPHHISPTRAPMARLNRAAQFAPFAALTGYEDAIGETARLTDRRIGLDEESLALINDRLRALLAACKERPEATFLLFEPDSKKAGGAYTSVTGRVRRIDEVRQEVLLTDRTVIPMEQICGIDGDFFGF